MFVPTADLKAVLGEEECEGFLSELAADLYE